MDRRHKRGVDELLERDRQPVEVVVDDVEVSRALEGVRHVQRLPNATVERRVFRVAVGTHAVQLRRGLRIEGGEQRHVDAARVEATGEQSGDSLPRPVVARRRPPGDRSEDCDLHSDGGRSPEHRLEHLVERRCGQADRGVGGPIVEPQLARTGVVDETAREERVRHIALPFVRLMG
jgi:hypothetical protein